MSGWAFRRLATAAAALLPALASALAAEPAPWPDSFVGRLEALALIETLNADLLSHDSATLTLERWCADHRLADPARIVAERVHDVDKPATPEVRAALDVKADEPLGYRRVRLKCGDHVLSDADNWYVPARLTPEMNHVLETTDTPFGKAVAALRFRRHTLSRRICSGAPCRRTGRRARRRLRLRTIKARWPCLITCSSTAPSCRRPTASRSAKWSRPIPAKCWPSRRRNKRGLFRARLPCTPDPIWALRENPGATHAGQNLVRDGRPRDNRRLRRRRRGHAQSPGQAQRARSGDVRGDHRGGRAAEPDGGLARRRARRRGQRLLRRPR